MELNENDIAGGGIAVLCLEINNKKYFLGWADANKHGKWSERNNCQPF